MKETTIIVRIEPDLKTLAEKRVASLERAQKRKIGVSEYIRALIKKDIGFKEPPIV